LLQVRLEPPLNRALVELAEQRFQSKSALIKGLILREATDAGMRPEPQRVAPLAAAAAGTTIDIERDRHG
jgi:predicted transcriptional regulator